MKVSNDFHSRYKSQRDFRYVHCTRYASRLDMLQMQQDKDLYHIEISERNYIEFV